MLTHPHLSGGRLTVDLEALVANWRLLNERSKPGKAAAVVKANAYGLGIQAVAPALYEAGCRDFFVALPEEGITLKKCVSGATVYLLNGIHTDSVASVAEAGLVPILGSRAQIDLWAEHCRARGRRLPCGLQVDTGMNRLGLTVDEAIEFASDNKKHFIVPLIHVMSHFACADDPANPLNQQQIESFQRVVDAFDNVDSSLSNSAATLWGGALGHTMTRPGIALYGGEAVNDRPNSMQTVVKLEGRIVQIRHAKAGETVSYGATQTLARDTKIATVSVGYADGYPRAASGAGVPLRQTVETGIYGAIGGHRAAGLGRITMDLMMFDVTDIGDEALAGGWIELIGPNVPLDDVARAGGTIGYEVLTSLGARYHQVATSC
ncbi:MAG: alanine racemase [Ahrensia sp.]